jgi:hypothetical protein
MWHFATNIHTVIAASPDAWDPPVFGPTLAMACCIAWLNISGVIRLPPVEGPAAEDVLEPVARGEAGNKPDDKTLYLQNHYLQHVMDTSYLCTYRSYSLFQDLLLLLLVMKLGH